MEQSKAMKARPVIFDSDKKQNFGVSDAGEFIDNIYREHDSSKLYGRLIGRTYVAPHSKKTFTSADIVCEGYLHKKGSWMKNWKKRYFILRKDIRAICYYVSREDLTLLGSIPLDIESEVCNVQPEKADGFAHVISVETTNADGSPSSTSYIKFDNFEQMKVWMIDIKNEAHNMRLPESSFENWWQTLFGELTAMEPKSLARRDGLTSAGGGGPSKSAGRGAVSAPDGEPRAIATSKSGGMSLKNNGTGTSVSSSSPLNQREDAQQAPTVTLTSCQASKKADLSDDEQDSDDEKAGGSEKGRGGGVSIPGTPIMSRNESGTTTGGGSSSREISLDGKSSSASMVLAGDELLKMSSRHIVKERVNKRRSERVIKKVKAPKKDKPPGPPPFEQPTADRFETEATDGGDVSRALSGLQLSVRMCNVCGYQDRIFIVVFGNGSNTEMQAQPNKNEKHASTDYSASSAPSSSSAPFSSSSSSSTATSASSSGNSGATVAAAATPEAAVAATQQNQSKWTQLSRTEVRTVVDKPDYGENYVSEVKIHFHLLQDLIPDYCKEIKVVVYRLENEMNAREPGKATNLSMQLEIARAVFSRKQLEKDFLTTKKLNMSVKIEMPMDIAIPLFKESDVQLGIVKLSSSAMYEHRRLFTQDLGILPYSEMLYSFCTQTGQTLSQEQLYASKFSVGVAAGLLGLYRAERHDFLKQVLNTMEAEYNLVVAEHEEMIRPHLAPGENAEEKTRLAFSSLRQAIDDIEDIYYTQEEAATSVLDSCAASMTGQDMGSTVIAGAQGGGYLRRSTWKKHTAWQYMTTNLNVHMLTSKHFTFTELAAANIAGDDKQYKENASNFHSNMHYSPTMTLGVPAAHELKFHEGGLRRIFLDITDTAQKLKWMQALQLPTMDYLKTLMTAHPKEAAVLFGAKNTFVSKEDMATVLKRKSELCRRIDICGSQALGLAVTSIKTICTLAAQVGGQYIDVLARNLKIGFLIMFESMLSTQGDELGMIEDMDLAALWLSLVTVRLVVTPTAVKQQPQPQPHTVLPPPPPSPSATDSPASFSAGRSGSSAATSTDGSSSVSLSQDLSRLVLQGKGNSSSSIVDSRSSTIGGGGSVGTAAGIAEAAHQLKRASATSYSNEGMLVVGRGDGIACFRDKSGRLTVDIEISEKEAAAVLEAREYMNGFDRVSVTQSLPSDCNFAFRPPDSTTLASSVNANTNGSSSNSNNNSNQNSPRIGDGDTGGDKDNRADWAQQSIKQGSSIVGQKLVDSVRRNQHQFTTYVPDREHAPRVFAVVELFGVVFSQGINEMQTLANMSSSRDVHRQIDVNVGSMARLESFYQSYWQALQYQLVRRTPDLLDFLVEATAAAAREQEQQGVKRGVGTRKTSLKGFPVAAAAGLASTPGNLAAGGTVGLSITVESLKTKVMNTNDRAMDQARKAVAANSLAPFEKHVDVLLKCSALCRMIGGTIGILCKSGKDRTSMGVTLENTRALVEDLGAQNGQEICQSMRLQGVRRMNVYANTGQPMFAFNQIQRIALPNCYRAPPGSHAGNVVS